MLPSMYNGFTKRHFRIPAQSPKFSNTQKKLQKYLSNFEEYSSFMSLTWGTLKGFLLQIWISPNPFWMWLTPQRGTRTKAAKLSSRKCSASSNLSRFWSEEAEKLPWIHFCPEKNILTLIGFLIGNFAHLVIRTLCQTQLSN